MVIDNDWKKKEGDDVTMIVSGVELSITIENSWIVYESII